MTKKTQQNKNAKAKVSYATEVTAMKIAKANQRPEQTKEQTKLIAQGIQKGIEQYKKQYKEKVRDLDKQKKKYTSQQSTEQTNGSEQQVTHTTTKSSHLAWILLIASWIGFAAYILLM
jgi:hypothetical protein